VTINKKEEQYYIRKAIIESPWNQSGWREKCRPMLGRTCTWNGWVFSVEWNREKLMKDENENAEDERFVIPFNKRTWWWWWCCTPVCYVFSNDMHETIDNNKRADFVVFCCLSRLCLPK